MNIFSHDKDTQDLATMTETKIEQPPPSYQSTTTKPKPEEPQSVVVGADCQCHDRYQVMKARVEELGQRYADTPKDLKKPVSYDWELQRIMKLLGIVRAPVEKCSVACECHEELIVLRGGLKWIEEGNAGILEKRSKGKFLWSKGELKSFYRHQEDIKHLNGMMRSCKAKNAEP